jgi:transcriptional repressor OPI1
MEYQQAQAPYAAQLSFPQVPTGPLKSAELIQTTTIDTDMIMTDNDRSQRAASVLSGMSAEDMEAAETLNSLHASKCPKASLSSLQLIRWLSIEFHTPPQSQRPPTHLQTTSSYDDTQPEPLLSLLTSQHPIAATLINGSLSAYKTTQSYIPGACFVERNVGLPLAGTIGRVTGVEGGLRWALQRRESSDQTQGQRKPDLVPLNESTNGVDVEKGFGERPASGNMRRSSQLSFVESLPAYDEAGRSPPYQEEQQLVLQSRERQPPPGWRAQLMITTSGLGIAMRDESLQSLRYCLSWLTWANQRLGGAIQNLKDLLHRWDGQQSDQERESRQATISARVAALKADVLSTLKQVVEVVSNYAGGALPENARNLVHRHLTSLPQRFSLASAISSNAENGSEAASSAHRVMVLAQEGLDMMSQVSRVVNDTLVSAESWCEKLGKRRPETQGQSPFAGDMKIEHNRQHTTLNSRDEGHDVKMEM